MDAQVKDQPDIKRPSKKKRHKQQQTDNVPTDDVVSTDGTNKGGGLLFANKPRTFPQRIESIIQWNQRTRELQYILN